MYAKYLDILDVWILTHLWILKAFYIAITYVWVKAYKDNEVNIHVEMYDMRNVQMVHCVILCDHFKNDFDVFEVRKYFCPKLYDKDLDKLDACIREWLQVLCNHFKKGFVCID